MSAVTPVDAEQDAGEYLWFGGGLVEFKVTSAQTGGSLLIFEQASSCGKSTPLHLHPGFDETGYVIEGEILTLLDGVEHTAGPGDAAFLPRGVPHAFIITSDVARILWVVTPGEVMEAFIRQAGDVASSRILPPADIDIPRLLAAGERTGAMQVLGPPPFPPVVIPAAGHSD